MTAKNPNYANQNATSTDQAGMPDTSGTDQVKQSASEVTDQTKQAATQVTDQAKQAARSQLAARKDQTAQGLNVVSSAVRDMGDRLRQNDQTSSYAGAIENAANQIQRLSGYLHNRDVGQITGEVEDWARRDPMLALGGAFVLGLLAARFLKSSGIQKRSGTMRPSGYRSGYAPGYRPTYRYDNQYYGYGRYGDQYGENVERGTTYHPAERYWNEQTGTWDTDNRDIRETQQ